MTRLTTSCSSIPSRFAPHLRRGGGESLRATLSHPVLSENSIVRIGGQASPSAEEPPASPVNDNGSIR